jgi:hypothetical protein
VTMRRHSEHLRATDPPANNGRRNHAPASFRLHPAVPCHSRRLRPRRPAMGHDMRRQPWHARRVALAELLHGAPTGIVLSEHFDDDGAAMFRHACALGLEGIVSKRRDAPYRSGRCADWIKIKTPNAPAATRVMEW